MNNSLLHYNSSTSLKADEIYTYLLIQNQIFCNMDLHSLTLKNCILEKDIFSKALLADSDLDSSQIIMCTFENHSLQNSDIVSCTFEDCIFKHISFKGATLTNDTFINCEFISCDFNHITMTDSVFENCTIERMNMRQSSTSLNNFTKCTFKHSKINGNFFFNLLINCLYENTTMDISLISSNFGVVQDSINQLKLSSYDLQAYQQKLISENELFGAAIIELNTNEYSYDYSTAVCMQFVFKQLQNNIIIRSEELRFIELILDYFISNKLLAPITIIQLLSIVESIQNSTINNIAKQQSATYITYIHNVLFKAYQQYVTELHYDLSDITIKNLPITVKITFKEEPSIQICTILTELQKQLNILTNPPTRIKTEKGSFIEWIQGPDNIIKCLQLIVSILGIAIKLKGSSKKHTHEKHSNKDSSVNNNNSNTIVLQLPDSISRQINQVQTEQDISKVINVFMVNEMTINNNYQGFNKYNIQNVECLYE